MATENPNANANANQSGGPQFDEAAFEAELAEHGLTLAPAEGAKPQGLFDYKSIILKALDKAYEGQLLQPLRDMVQLTEQAGKDTGAWSVILRGLELGDDALHNLEG